MDQINGKNDENSFNLDLSNIFGIIEKNDNAYEILTGNKLNTLPCIKPGP